ncbi:MAG TPA: NAD(P)H-binding protein [Segetibacter sp.]
MKAQTALVLGATGLIGSNLVELLLADDTYEKVSVLVRKEYKLNHPRLEVKIVNFNNIKDFEEKIGNGNSIFCCIGTTMKKVNGDKAAYKKIDYDIAVNAAQLGLAGGYTKYLLVSSISANANSKNFYLQLKGKVENTITTFSYRSIHVFQPSFLLGKRSEFRFGEMLGKGVMRALSLGLYGSLKKYRAIDATTVAKAMIAASKRDEAGNKVYTYNEILEIVRP